MRSFKHRPTGEIFSYTKNTTTEHTARHGPAQTGQQDGGTAGGGENTLESGQFTNRKGSFCKGPISHLTNIFKQ